MELRKGQNGPLTAAQVVVGIDIPADLSALLVQEDGKVRSDADFVFFNQPAGPGVRLDNGRLNVTFTQIPADIAQVRAVITLESGTFGAIAAPVATVSDGSGNVLYRYSIDGLSSESIVIAIELYRRGADWKVRAVGQGYAGGFAALVTDHGVSVDEAEPEPDVRTVPSEQKLSLEKRQKLDLRKQAVAKVLLDKGAKGIRARLVLVIDKTGSMTRLYSKQVVHRVVERMVPVATQIDDDGQLEAYLYAVRFARLPDITVDTAEQWAAEYLHLGGVHGGIKYKEIGGYNDELPIMNEIIGTLRPDGEPTLVLFFTDGGFSKKQQITDLMRRASTLPAFWQFVGLGKANYGLLEALDTLDGRAVDNAGFFALDDIDSVDDAELYRRLLGEFPDWLRAARTAGIIR